MRCPTFQCTKPILGYGKGGCPFETSQHCTCAPFRDNELSERQTCHTLAFFFKVVNDPQDALKEWSEVHYIISSFFVFLRSSSSTGKTTPSYRSLCYCSCTSCVRSVFSLTVPWCNQSTSERRKSLTLSGESSGPIDLGQDRWIVWQYNHRHFVAQL